MEHRLEMSPEKMIEALGNEVRIRDREIEKLKHFIKYSGTIELASENTNLTSYMFHWEGRALDAEKEVERLRKLSGKIIESFRVNMMRSCQEYSHEEFDKLINSLQQKDDNND